MMRLARKLKHLKFVLRAWNREVFGNIRQQICHLEERLARLEVGVQEWASEEDEQDYLVAKAKLDVWSKREEIRQSQQAKQNWLTHREASAQFFSTLSKKGKTWVHQMKLQDESWLKSPEEVHEGAVE